MTIVRAVATASATNEPTMNNVQVCGLSAPRLTIKDNMGTRLAACAKETESTRFKSRMKLTSKAILAAEAPPEEMQ